jgi:hypothetical protein
MATKKKIKSHKPERFCPICGKKHTRSAHLSHGKGSFERFPSRKGKTKATKKISKAVFLRRMNKGRKKAGLKPIPIRK